MQSRFPLSPRRLQWQKGAVTVTYLYPGTVVPPVIPSPLPQNTVIATLVAGATTDVIAEITHMFGLANSEITQGFPIPIMNSMDGAEITSPWYEVSEASNYSVFAKNNTATGSEYKIAITRPHSIVR